MCVPGNAGVREILRRDFVLANLLQLALINSSALVPCRFFLFVICSNAHWCLPRDRLIRTRAPVWVLMSSERSEQQASALDLWTTVWIFLEHGSFEEREWSSGRCLISMWFLSLSLASSPREHERRLKHSCVSVILAARGCVALQF